MRKTERYRNHHVGIIKITSEISALLSINELSNNAQEVFKLLSKLLVKMNFHFAMEDKSFYPMLIEHSDERIRTVAKMFRNEMGGLAETFKDYESKWNGTAAIQDNPRNFIEQTQTIFSALSKRIERENNILYKMVDESLS